jgi:hypothetical protein
VPTRRGTVDGRPLAIYDGLVPLADMTRYAEILHRAPFTRTETARPDTAEHRHWVNEMAVAGLPHLPLWHATERALRDFSPDRRYKPYRAYTNHAAFGDMLFTHTDCLPESDELTALWFLCDRWDIEWGGETVFFDASGDAAFCASPRPGRLVVFHGAIVHAGRPPNRVYYGPRYTFALKLERA